MSPDLILRCGIFVLVLLVLVVLEWWRPIRPSRPGRAARVFDNVSLMLVGAALLALVSLSSAVAAAWIAQRYGWGLFHALEVRLAVAFVLSLLLLDLALYGQHRLMHQWPLLWRLHRVHHSATDLDVSAGVRFHPAEALVSMGFKALVVIALGAPPAAVLLFEILLNGFSLFTHANLRLPPAAERVMRRIFITPGVHWIHHSEVPAEQTTNFGFCLSLWDRCFGTWLDQATRATPAIRHGVQGLEGDVSGVGRLLVQPVRDVTP